MVVAVLIGVNVRVRAFTLLRIVRRSIGCETTEWYCVAIAYLVGVGAGARS